MAKLNIYIPDELKTRMDPIDDVSWSEVVRPAILAKVSTYEQRTSKDITTAIERLRASKQKFLRAEQDGGAAAGRAWAEDRAEYEDLVALAWRTLPWRQRHPDACEPGLDVLREAVNPDQVLNDDEVREYLFDGNEPGEEFARAFVKGAVDFFAEVHDKI